MKKIYSLLITLAAGSMLSLSAQQLPSYGFEETWVNCVPWNSANVGKVQGTQPDGWCASNVTGKSTAAAQTVVSQIAGYNSDKAIKMFNKKVMSQLIPGYVTLGTTWSTAKASGVGTIAAGTADGGTWGGMDFTYRPDALQLYYKRPSSSNQPATVLIYSWKGETTQIDVPAENSYSFVNPSDPTKVTMTNRDRCVIDELATTSLGGEVTKSTDFELISKTIHKITSQANDWKMLTIDIDYKTTSTPSKFNVIFSAGDYLADKSNLVENDELDIDNVKLLYYSRLASLSVNGTDVAGFDPDTYSYTVKGDMPDESGFAYTTLGNSGSGRASIALDQANNVATITVTNTNAGGTDIDGQTSHVYTISFQPQIDITGGDIYKGTILIKGEEAGLGGDIERAGEVHIITAEDGSITFALPDFALTDDAEGYIGDIVVNGLTVTEADGVKTYNGVVKGLALKMAGMDIVANVTVNGTVDADGKAVMTINVIWLQYPEDDPEGTEYGLTIPVEFNGQMEKQDDPKPSYGGNVYDGTVTVQGEEAGLGGDIVRDGRVHIINNADGTTTFVLPDFALADDPSAYIGDIVVNGLTMTEADGVKTYSGVVKGLALKLDGNDIVANVIVNGTVDATGNAVMQIDVVWLINPEDDPEGESGLKIPVLFNGQYNASMGIEDIPVDNSNAPVQWYNIRGMRVNGENLAPGIYIRRQGTQVEKILIR